MNRSDRPTSPTPQSGAGLVRWLVAAAILTITGAVLAVTVFSGDPPTTQRTPAAWATPIPSPTPSPTPPPSPTPMPTVPPVDSLIHAMHLPGPEACPNFSLRRTRVPGEELETYLQSVLDCLVSVNSPAFAQAGLTLHRPALAPQSEVARSGCVNIENELTDWAGLYCPANQTMFYRTDWEPEDPLQYVEVITHEFTHHLQHEVGILDAVAVEQTAARKEPNGEIKALELSRRLELQAECVTGVIVGPEGPIPVRSRELAQFIEARSSVASEWAPSHGSGRAQTYWFRTGSRAKAPHQYAECNTFAAPAERVE